MEGKSSNMTKTQFYICPQCGSEEPPVAGACPCGWVATPLPEAADESSEDADNASHYRRLYFDANARELVLRGAIDSLTSWLLHAHGPESPEGMEAQTCRAALTQPPPPVVRREVAEKLAEALTSLKHADGCFCDAAFAMPGQHPRHMDECKAVCAALARLEKEGL